MALLYGDDDFQKSLMIVNTCGWDTDCNSGNVGCLLGIKNGLAGIDAGPDWRGPVADRMYLPTADGGRAITDAVREAVPRRQHRPRPGRRSRRSPPRAAHASTSSCPAPSRASYPKTASTCAASSPWRTSPATAQRAPAAWRSTTRPRPWRRRASCHADLHPLAGGGALLPAARLWTAGVATTLPWPDGTTRRWRRMRPMPLPSPATSTCSVYGADDALELVRGPGSDAGPRFPSRPHLDSSPTPTACPSPSSASSRAARHTSTARSTWTS